ncbi:MAG: serine hydrolase domain-containing protein, partial [Candidatus Heimdallarchaeaceae archaeon]
LTATAVLNFVEKGLLSLDEDVNNMLLGWKIPENEFTTKKKVTLRHLLSHTSGINRPKSLLGTKNGKTPTLEQVLNGESPAINDPVEVLFVPGTKYEYSNFGYIILQKLLEDITGKAFPRIMDEIIFSPLKMSNSTFEYLSEAIRKRAVVPHDENGEAKESGLHPIAFAQGGLITAPLDLSKFVIELINAYNGKSSNIFSSSMVRTMLTPEVELDPMKFFGFTGQGLGMFLIENERAMLFTHPGTNMPGATCNIIGCPKTGQGAVLMANGIKGELLLIEILNSIVQEYNWPLWEK